MPLPRPATSADVSPDSRFLAICRGAPHESWVFLMDVDTLERIELPIPTGVVDLVFRPGSTQLATLNQDGTLALWELESILNSR